jgi:hypothetical protein
VYPKIKQHLYKPIVQNFTITSKKHFLNNFKKNVNKKLLESAKNPIFCARIDD